jgi:hypothetical protein
MSSSSIIVNIDSTIVSTGDAIAQQLQSSDGSDGSIVNVRTTIVARGSSTAQQQCAIAPMMRRYPNIEYDIADETEEDARERMDKENDDDMSGYLGDPYRYETRPYLYGDDKPLYRKEVARIIKDFGICNNLEPSIFTIADIKHSLEEDSFAVFWAKLCAVEAFAHLSERDKRRVVNRVNHVLVRHNIIERLVTTHILVEAHWHLKDAIQYANDAYREDVIRNGIRAFPASATPVVRKKDYTDLDDDNA